MGKLQVCVCVCLWSSQTNTNLKFVFGNSQTSSLQTWSLQTSSLQTSSLATSQTNTKRKHKQTGICKLQIEICKLQNWNLKIEILPECWFEQRFGGRGSSNFKFECMNSPDWCPSSATAKPIIAHQQGSDTTTPLRERRAGPRPACGQTPLLVVASQSWQLASKTLTARFKNTKISPGMRWNTRTQ